MGTTQQRAHLAELERIANGRDHIRTDEFAQAVNRAPQTARKSYSESGHAWGIRPVKFGNRLLWPVVDVAVLLSGRGK